MNSELSLLKDRTDIYFVYAGFIESHSFFHRKPSNIVEDLINQYALGKRLIFFDGREEAMSKFSIIKIHSVINSMKEKGMKFLYITGASDGEEQYVKFCKEKNLDTCMNVLSYPFFERLLKEHNPNKSYQIGHKDKAYTCLNRVLRLHRISLLEKLLEEQLVNEQCFYSFYDTQLPDGGISKIPERFKNIHANIELVKGLRLNFDPNRINPNTLTAEDSFLFDNSYFSLVTETLFYETNDTNVINEIFFTEKTFKPIAMVQPFILVSRPNMLAALRDKGYKTFHPYINEEYDTTINDDDRMNLIVSETKRLCNQTKSEWLEWCTNIKPIVDFNKKHFHNQKSGLFRLT